MKTVLAVIGVIALLLVLSSAFLVLLMPKWYQRAADQGSAGAQFMLGTMYRDGRGVLRDEAKGIQWISKAAEQGLAKAQYTLGNMHAKGQGIPQDDAKAAQWYRKAAEQGYAEAQFRLGIMHLLGQGVAHDRQAGCRLLRASVEPGSAVEAVAVYNELCIAQKADIAKDELEKRLHDEMAKLIKSAEVFGANPLRPPGFFPGRAMQAGEQ
jgi:TPR repeat protein